MIRDALIINYTKLQKIDEGNKDNVSLIYAQLHSIIAKEISSGIRDKFQDSEMNSFTNDIPEEERILRIDKLEQVINDNGNELSRNKEYKETEIWNYDTISKSQPIVHPEMIK